METNAGFGDILKQTRERKGINISTAAGKLRVREDILRAIEHSDFTAMPPRGYARNMIAGYARYLGLDAVRITSQYLDELQQYRMHSSKSVDRTRYNSYGQYAQYEPQNRKDSTRHRVSFSEKRDSGNNVYASRSRTSRRQSSQRRSSRRGPSDANLSRSDASRRVPSSRHLSSHTRADIRSSRHTDRNEYASSNRRAVSSQRSSRERVSRRGQSRSQHILQNLFGSLGLIGASRHTSKRDVGQNHPSRRSQSQKSHGQGSYGPSMPAVYAGRNPQDTNRANNRGTRNGFARHPNDLPLTNGHFPSIYTDSQAHSVFSDPRVRYIAAGILLIVLVIVLCVVLFGRTSKASQDSVPHMPVTSLDEESSDQSQSDSSQDATSGDNQTSSSSSQSGQTSTDATSSSTDGSTASSDSSVSQTNNQNQTASGTDTTSGSQTQSGSGSTSTSVQGSTTSGSFGQSTGAKSS